MNPCNKFKVFVRSIKKETGTSELLASLLSLVITYLVFSPYIHTWRNSEFLFNHNYSMCGRFVNISVAVTEHTTRTQHRGGKDLHMLWQTVHHWMKIASSENLSTLQFYLFEMVKLFFIYLEEGCPEFFFSFTLGELLVLVASIVLTERHLKTLLFFFSKFAVRDRTQLLNSLWTPLFCFWNHSYFFIFLGSFFFFHSFIPEDIKLLIFTFPTPM